MRESRSDATSPAISEIARPWKLENRVEQDDRGARDEVDHVSCDNAANIPIHALHLTTGRDCVSESSIATLAACMRVGSDRRMPGDQTATQPGPDPSSRTSGEQSITPLGRRVAQAAKTKT